MTVFTAEHLSLGYEGQAILSDISFSLEDGDYLCIVGDNGAGKSTLVKAVLGLLEPLGGTLRFNVSANSIGYLPQSSQLDKAFPTVVREVVLSGALSRLAGRFFYSRADRARAEENIIRMGLRGMENHSFQELSGGQRQRVLLARALTAAERVLLLDEPVSGLDIHSASELYALISHLNSQGMTIIMVTHDIHPALNSATKILHLGRSIFFGTRDEYFASEEGRNYLKEAGHND